MTYSVKSRCMPGKSQNIILQNLDLFKPAESALSGIRHILDLCLREWRVGAPSSIIWPTLLHLVPTLLHLGRAMLKNYPHFLPGITSILQCKNLSVSSFVSFFGSATFLTCVCLLQSKSANMSSQPSWEYNLSKQASALFISLKICHILCQCKMPPGNVGLVSNTCM